MAKIKKISAREILDSRGNPTVEVEALLSDEKKVWAAVPSGSSTGRHEAHELRDGDCRRYGGRGVLQAVKNINKKIAPRLKGWHPNRQREADQLMIKLDGSPDKSKIGANAILGVSLALARAAALDSGQPLYRYLRKKFWPGEKSWVFPKPTMNILNGGAHSGWSIDIQEFMIVPQQKNIIEAVRVGAEVFQTLKEILKKQGHSITVGDEGGYAPKLGGNLEALKLISRAVKKAGYRPGAEVKFAVDVAASEFFKKEIYQMKADKKNRTVKEMIKMLASWLKKYPLESIEDGLAEDDWDGWRELTAQLGRRTVLIGDDLFVTNTARLKRGIKEKVANGILIKLNQIGSLSETVDCIKLAQKNRYKVSVSHRSGETSDDFIADLALAARADYLKAGSLSRGERVAKYNRLTEIWQELK